MNPPSDLIIGIKHNDYTIDERAINSSVFEFRNPAIARQDGMDEQSINWDDDEAAIPFTINQTNSDGELMFKAGVAIIKKKDLEKILRRPIAQNILSCERAPIRIDNLINSYHGNLLLKSSAAKIVKRQIKMTLATFAERLPIVD